MIRDLRESDRGTLAAIVLGIRAFDAADVDVAMELIDDRLAKGTDSDYEFVVDAEGDEVTGYACFGHIPLTESSFDLYWIAVSPKHQGRGVGKRLLHAAEEGVRALGGKRVYVETSSSAAYAGARAFYVALGYEEVARLPDFYRDGDGKAVFCRSLLVART